MQPKSLILAAKFGVILIVPIVLWAHAAGPDAHKTAVPGTGETSCNAALCHVGTPLNGGGGNVVLSAAQPSYTPGQKQTLTLRITDSAARVYGFQLTARLASDRTKQAGTFSSGPRFLVLCAATAVADVGTERVASGCPSSRPLEFIEHSAPFSTNTISVDWTAPADGAGAVELYLSANAANGNTTESGDHIYTTSLTLQPATSVAKPAISAGGIINAGQFGAKPGVAPGTWIEIYGQNLSTNNREWAGGDFSGTTAPTSLDGTSVTIAGKSAFVRFISPGQINAQVPDGIGTGPVPVVVTNGVVASDPVIITASQTLPGLLAPFNSGGKNYVAALQGTTVVGSPGFAAVKPGDNITLYGIGWGPVRPAVAAGAITPGLATLTGNLVLRLGQINVSNISYAGLGPNFVGLYQFNLVVPANTPDGDLQLDATVDGVSTGQTLFLTVKK